MSTSAKSNYWAEDSYYYRYAGAYSAWVFFGFILFIILIVAIAVYWNNGSCSVSCRSCKKSPCCCDGSPSSCGSDSSSYSC